MGVAESESTGKEGCSQEMPQSGYWADILIGAISAGGSRISHYSWYHHAQLVFSVRPFHAATHSDNNELPHCPPRPDGMV